MLESLDIVGAFSSLRLENSIFVTHLIIARFQLAISPLRIICNSYFNVVQ